MRKLESLYINEYQKKQLPSGYDYVRDQSLGEEVVHMRQFERDLLKRLINTKGWPIATDVALGLLRYNANIDLRLPVSKYSHFIIGIRHY